MIGVRWGGPLLVMILGCQVVAGHASARLPIIESIPALPAMAPSTTAPSAMHKHLAVGVPKLRLLIFTRTDCPIAQRYVPTLKEIDAKYTPLGLSLDWVFPIDAEDDQAILAFAHEFGLGGSLHRDRRSRLAHRYAIRVTPEVVLLSEHGGVLYQGRIDDRFVTFGVTRPAPQQSDLAVAIEDALAQRPIRNPRTKAVGCYLEG